jgi:hypothetical protein
MIIHSKFHKDWFRYSGVNRGDAQHRQHGDFISLLVSFKNKEIRLKRRLHLSMQLWGFEPVILVLVLLEALWALAHWVIVIVNIGSVRQILGIGSGDECFNTISSRKLGYGINFWTHALC